MLKTRPNTRQLSTTNTQPNAERSLSMRDRRQADALLRDMAYVLHLTRTVRQSMTTPTAS